jgi:hypothetical protein
MSLFTITYRRPFPFSGSHIACLYLLRLYLETSGKGTLLGKISAGFLGDMLRSCGLEMAIARSPYIIVGLISGFSSLLPSHSHSMRAYSDEFAMNS